MLHCNFYFFFMNLYINFLPLNSDTTLRARMPPKRRKSARSSAGSEGRGKGKDKGECLTQKCSYVCVWRDTYFTCTCGEAW